MIVIKKEGSRPIKAWVDSRHVPAPAAHLQEPGVVLEDSVEPNIEASALEQLQNLAQMPYIHHNGVAVMPDVHAGIGSTVGSVIATVGALVPAAAGVDLGCGMNAVRLSLKASDLPESLMKIRSLIEQTIPCGFGQGSDHSSEQEISESDRSKLFQIAMKMGESPQRLLKRASMQAGSLGSGNHFIELCLDENQDVWVMLHSGSRGIGNIIGRYYIERAKELMKGFFITLPDKNLAYLPESHEEFENYREAVMWAQMYALDNRARMMREVLVILEKEIPVPFTLTSEAVQCHHNYVARENHFGANVWVTRKGAVRARLGELVIIPGSMGQKSYIARGKGNLEAYCSCSHGAGRVMSRTEAKRRFTVADLEKQTEGVECRKDEDVLDEIPSSYKDIDAVMANQKDLVEIVHTLKAVLCVKGS